MGRIFIGAVTERDYAMLQALILVYGVIFVVVNLIAEIAQAALDPADPAELDARPSPNPAGAFGVVFGTILVLIAVLGPIAIRADPNRSTLRTASPGRHRRICWARTTSVATR